MNIDMTSLLTNKEDNIKVDMDVVIDKELLDKSDIRQINDVHVNGEIVNDYDEGYLFKGNIKGVMVLPDDLTLEDVSCPFNSLLDEKITDDAINEDNGLDLMPILWQNILTEIPSKVNSGNRDIKLEGKGWRVISEDEVEDNNGVSPFSDLQKLLDSRKE